MARRETFQIIPYSKYYEPIELFAQPFDVRDAHTSVQIYLQEVCNKHSVNLHTGVYQLSPGELPKGSWTLAHLPGVLSKGSCLTIFAHQDSNFLWYFVLQMPSLADDLLNLERYFHSMIEDRALRDEGIMYSGDVRHEKFHNIAESIVRKHQHGTQDGHRFDNEWEAVYNNGEQLQR